MSSSFPTFMVLAKAVLIFSIFLGSEKLDFKFFRRLDYVFNSSSEISDESSAKFCLVNNKSSFKLKNIARFSSFFSSFSSGVQSSVSGSKVNAYFLAACRLQMLIVDVDAE